MRFFAFALLLLSAAAFATDEDPYILETDAFVYAVQNNTPNFKFGNSKLFY